MRLLFRPLRVMFAALWLSAAAPVAEPAYVAPYNALLSNHVSDGEKEKIASSLVDYSQWAKDKDHGDAVDKLSAVKPESLSGNAAAAFWINAYNLLTIDLIVRNKGTDSIRHIGDVLEDPWKNFTWTLGGKTMTLEAVEQQALRAKPGDMRVYLALCNGALSSPDLMMEAYSASRLEQQLDTQAAIFLRNPTKGTKNWGTVLQVSRLFKPLMVEFEQKGGLVPFLRQHNKAIPPKAMLQGYFDYNWTLNGDWQPEAAMLPEIKVDAPEAEKDAPIEEKNDAPASNTPPEKKAIE